MYAYPIICHIEDGMYLAVAPDLPGVVVGANSMDELLKEASNGCAMWLDDALTKNEQIPTPSEAKSLVLQPNEFLSHALIDLIEFRRKYRSRAIRKTISIPDWMSKEAERRGFSLSQILQDALRERLANA